ncbi:putative E3 ubiquitin ligase [Handroanthus impetiginosus]|uniref:Putative E3 ubiquitin ligase n=1 Tax=Handroanthus impetiginosus TaxID=429701 RepID=A0A2G9G092_9LAMI|nr:putative E3 ubiquitin ligase [Handroanthus impetiginosus]
MPGSRGGKHSKSKGKLKNTNNKNPALFNSKPDLAQTSNKYLDGPKDSKDKNPQPNVNSALARGRSKYEENELEAQLYAKLQGLYAEARDWLLKSGYTNQEVETAILNAGYIHGPVDLMTNILTNSIAFIERRFEQKRDAFKDIGELYKHMLEILVSSAMQTRLYKQRSEAMYHLLVAHWGSVPPTNMTSHPQRGNQNMNSIHIHGSDSSSHIKNAVDSSSAVEAVPSETKVGSSSKKVGILERINFTPKLKSHFRQSVLSLKEAVQREISTPVINQQASPSVGGRQAEVDIMTSDFRARLKGWLERGSDDSRTELILELVEEVRDLEEVVKEEKEWAERKVRDSARKLSKDLLELRMLRMEAKMEISKDETMMIESSCTSKLVDTEKSLQEATHEASLVIEAVERLETTNAQIRADIEALKLNASESERQLKEVLKRERRCMKKLADNEKQTSILRSQCEEEKQRVRQLELELLQAEKEIEEIEIKWWHENKKKEHMFARLAEETKMADIQRANSRTQLRKLRQKLEVDHQLARDRQHKLQDELSHLQSHQMPKLPEDESVFYNFEATSSEPSASCESSEETVRRWDCMICLKNKVSMVFLPCRHQVICSPCYVRSCHMVRTWCLYCQVEIEDSIRVYGPNS